MDNYNDYSPSLSEYDEDACFKIVGVIDWEDDWCLLKIDELLEDIDCEYNIKPTKKPHVSVIKNEVPQKNGEDWGSYALGVEVTVTVHPTSSTNGLHVWLNVHSPELCRIREHFGLSTLESNGNYLVNFHYTVGYLSKKSDRKKLKDTINLRPSTRISQQSHIDEINGMQHL